MDLDNFPAPYDEQVPQAIREAREELSPEGGAVLERILLVREPADPGEIFPYLKSLPQRDFAIVLSIVTLLEEAFAAAQEAAATKERLAKQTLGIFRRAYELDPALPRDASLWQAVAVLERHGEPLMGVSREVLEMSFELKRRPTDEERR